jgi:hypothetical protein
MEVASEQKIWRYMDFSKFLSLLTSRSLYFACPSELGDPYEGCLPKIQAQALSELIQRPVDDVLALRPNFAAKSVGSLVKFDKVMSILQKNIQEATTKAASKFGVSCWHISDHESDAMWKIYAASGKGVAVESTVENLRASLGGRKDIQIDAVRYDFEDSTIEKGHKHYFLLQKRKCFEHEKELRATIVLAHESHGMQVPCDLDVLVTRIWMSPLLENYAKDAIETLCLGTVRPLLKPVMQSQILTRPDYGVQIDLGLETVSA